MSPPHESQETPTKELSAVLNTLKTEVQNYDHISAPLSSLLPKQHTKIIAALTAKIKSQKDKIPTTELEPARQLLNTARKIDQILQKILPEILNIREGKQAAEYQGRIIDNNFQSSYRFFVSLILAEAVITGVLDIFMLNTPGAFTSLICAFFAAKFIKKHKINPLREFRNITKKVWGIFKGFGRKIQNLILDEPKNTKQKQKNSSENPALKIKKLNAFYAFLILAVMSSAGSLLSSGLPLPYTWDITKRWQKINQYLNQTPIIPGYLNVLNNRHVKQLLENNFFDFYSYTKNGFLQTLLQLLQILEPRKSYSISPAPNLDEASYFDTTIVSIFTASVESRKKIGFPTSEKLADSKFLEDAATPFFISQDEKGPYFDTNSFVKMQMPVLQKEKYPELTQEEFELHKLRYLGYIHTKRKILCRLDFKETPSSFSVVPFRDMTENITGALTAHVCPTIKGKESLEIIGGNIPSVSQLSSILSILFAFIGFGHLLKQRLALRLQRRKLKKYPVNHIYIPNYFIQLERLIQALKECLLDPEKFHMDQVYSKFNSILEILKDSPTNIPDINFSKLLKNLTKEPFSPELKTSETIAAKKTRDEPAGRKRTPSVRKPLTSEAWKDLVTKRRNAKVKAQLASNDIPIQNEVDTSKQIKAKDLPSLIPDKQFFKIIQNCGATIRSGQGSHKVIAITGTDGDTLNAVVQRYKNEIPKHHLVTILEQLGINMEGGLDAQKFYESYCAETNNQYLCKKKYGDMWIKLNI